MLFQLSTTRCEKKFLRTSSLDLCFLRLRGWAMSIPPRQPQALTGHGEPCITLHFVLASDNLVHLGHVNPMPPLLQCFQYLNTLLINNKSFLAWLPVLHLSFHSSMHIIQNTCTFLHPYCPASILSWISESILFCIYTVLLPYCLAFILSCTTSLLYSVFCITLLSSIMYINVTMFILPVLHSLCPASILSCVYSLYCVPPVQDPSHKVNNYVEEKATTNIVIHFHDLQRILVSHVICR